MGLKEKKRREVTVDGEMRNQGLFNIYTAQR
jgi:hypothetical protein